MRYAELLEYTFPTIQHVNVKSNKHPGRAADRGDSESLGSGSFADAWANPKKTPHDIRKIANEPRKRQFIDGFYFYLLELENHPDNTNPYFPRFRNIKIYTDSRAVDIDDKITYSVQMERLFPMQELNKSEQNAIINRLFDAEYVDKVHKILNKKHHPWGKKLLTVIQTAVELPETETLNTLIVDDEFKRAISFIKKTAHKNELMTDLHDENIMVRRGPTGPQLVFTDPLSYQT